jgi:hypothetical protein
MNKIGMNLHGLNIKNRGVLFSRLYALRPPVVLVLDSLGLAQDIKAKLPETLVIYRQFEHGEKIHEKYNAEQWLDNHASHGANRVVIHVGNEMDFTPAVLDWLLRVCNRAVVKDVTVCIGNWAVGNPEPEKWPLARELLKFASEHREHVIIGLHEYSGGVITSGLIGGYPDNAGKPPGVPGGINLIQPESWPKDISKMTCYHMGRFKFMLDYCYMEDIEPPRIVITEAGFDDTSDIKAWEDTLKKTPPYLNIRGWRTLTAQWTEWFGRKGWSADRAYAEQLIHSDKYWYADPAIEGRCGYCYGHSSDEWKPFDTEDAVEFWDLVTKYAKEQAPMFPLPGDKRWVAAENFSGQNWRIRLIAKADETPELGWVRAGEKFSYVGIEGNSEWMFAKNFIGIIGYASRDLLTIVPASPPIEPDPPAPTTVDLKQDRDVLDILIKQLEDELSDLNHAVAKVDTRLKLLRTVREDIIKLIA